jgi:methionine aminopeptidase
MVICIEPMICFGAPKTKTLKDNWTVICENICAHFEKTVFVGEDKIHVIGEIK